MKTVKYPEMRAEFLAELRYVFLADPSEKTRRQRAFEYLVNFVYDDTALSRNPESLLGWVLLNTREVDLIKRFTGCLDSLLSKNGVALKVSDVESTESWYALVSQAAILLDEMK